MFLCVFKPENSEPYVAFSQDLEAGDDELLSVFYLLGDHLDLRAFAAIGELAIQASKESEPQLEKLLTELLREGIELGKKSA